MDAEPRLDDRGARSYRGDGDSGKAQCTVEVSHEDFKTMLGDPNAGMQLYFQGKLRVSGDPMLAMKLQQLFEIARPK